MVKTASFLDSQQKEHIVYIKKSKRQSVGYYIRSDGSLELRLPNYIADSQAMYYINLKKDWFLKKQREVLKAASQKHYSSFKEGETLYIFGQAYTIINQVDIQKKVTLLEDKVHVSSHRKLDDAELKNILENWLKEQLKIKAQQAIEQNLKCFDEPLGYKQLRIRKMKSSWGNMRKNGIMTLNLALAHTPQEVIDLIIVHELCHLQYFDHSKAFYALMSKVMPRWKEYEKQLKLYSAMSY
ncbi:MAG: M48 family metallopeptidase [Alphaproteobacteria bacterium]